MNTLRGPDGNPVRSSPCAACLLAHAPYAVDEKQLRELHIRLRQQVQTSVEVEKG